MSSTRRSSISRRQNARARSEYERKRSNVVVVSSVLAVLALALAVSVPGSNEAQRQFMANFNPVNCGNGLPRVIEMGGLVSNPCEASIDDRKWAEIGDLETAAGGWVIWDMGIFRDGSGDDIQYVDVGDGADGKVRGGQMWVAPDGANLNVNPNLTTLDPPNGPANGNPQTPGWSYITPKKPPHLACNESMPESVPESYNACWVERYVKLNVGNDDGKQYRYIYFWADGAPSGPGGSSADAIGVLPSAACTGPDTDRDSIPDMCDSDTVTGITILPTSATKQVTQTQQFTEEQLCGSNSCADQTAIWASSTPAVVTVDANGLATAVSPGTATITVTSVKFPTRSATAQFTVTAPSVLSVKVSPASMIKAPTQTQQFTAAVDCGNSTPCSQSVTWNSSNTSVATVNASGLVTASSLGATVITATSVQNPSMSDTAALIVVHCAADASVAMTPPTASLIVLQTQQFSGTVTGCDISKITWTSSNQGTATVDPNGLVTAIAPGTVTITAASANDSNIKATATVTVGHCLTTATVTMSPTTANMNVSETKQFSGTVTGCDISKITWTSSNQNIATVDPNGLVTALAPGTVAIIAASANDANVKSAVTIVVTSNTAITYNVIYDAAGGQLPQNACPAWSRADTNPANAVSIQNGILSIQTSNDPDTVRFIQSQSELVIPDTLSVEAKLRIVSGATNNAPDGIAQIVFVLPDGKQSALNVGTNELFLRDSSGSKAASASVDTTVAPHTYRVNVDKNSGAIAVFYDGALKLTGIATIPGGVSLTRPSIIWGEYSIYAHGSIEWNYLKHNAGNGQQCTNLSLNFTIPLEARDLNVLTSRGDHRATVTIRIFDAATKVKISEQTVQTDATGKTPDLTTTGLVTGRPYTVEAKTYQHVAGILRNIVLGTSNSFTFTPLLFGDDAGVNGGWGTFGDCTINNVDVAELYNHWGSHTNPQTDGDANGVVANGGITRGGTAAEDFSVLKAHLGQSCPVL